jgi:hypothetical protein
MKSSNHDLALSESTYVGALSARPRADLERESRSIFLRRKRATAQSEKGLYQ